MSENRLEIYLFSAPRLIYAGQPLALAVPRKAESLLAYLVMHRDVAITRDTVAFALWPDEKEGAARANLRRHVHLLNRALPSVTDSPWILSGMKTIRWNPQATVWIDVATFEKELAAEMPSALALFTGDLLAGVEDEWIEPIRVRLRNLYADSVLRSARTHRMNGDFDLAIRETQRLLERDRWREDAVRELMAARYGAGDRAGAIQEYWRFTTALQSELAVDPMPETISLYEAVLRSADRSELLAGDAGPVVARASRGQAMIRTRVQRPPQARQAQIVLPAAKSALIGRRAELEALDWHVEEMTKSNRGRAVVIEGAGGLGKSRILSEIPRLSSAASAMQASAVCFRYARSPLAPLIDVLTGLREQAPVAHDQRSQFLAIVEAFRRCSSVRPIVVTIDDLHWADDATLECLCFLAQKLSTLRAFFAFTYRPDALEGQPVAALLGTLKRAEAVSTLSLRPLQDDDIEQLALDITRETPPAPETLRRITLLAEGNPLFAEELIKHAVEAPAEDAARTLPLTLKAAVLQRFDEFDDAGRTLLTQAAVLGRDFSLPVLCSVSELKKESVSPILRKARDLQLIVEGRGGFATYSFRHALLREILYAELLRDEATNLHARVGSALESMPDAAAHVVELANHWFMTTDEKRASRYNELAGDEAASLFAHHDAIRFYRRALERSGGDDAKRAVIAEKIGDSFINAGEFVAAQETLNDALSYHERSSAAIRTASICLKMSVATWGAFDFQAALDWTQRAIRASESDPSNPVYLAALMRLARALVLRADASGAVECLRKAEAAENDSSPPHLRLLRASYQGLANGMLGHAQKALASFSSAEALLNDVQDPSAVHLFRGNYAIVLTWFGKTKAALDQLQLAAENARRAMNPMLESGCLSSATVVHVFGGDMLTARGLIDAAIRLAGQEQTFASLQAIGPGMLLALRLEDENLLHDLMAKVSLDDALKSGDPTFTTFMTSAYVDYYLQIGEIERARALIHEMVTNAGCAPNLFCVTIDAAYHGSTDDVKKLGDYLETWANSDGNDAGKAILALFRAIVAHRTGKKSARQHALKACAFFEQLDAPYHHAIGLELAGDLPKALEIHERMHNRRDAERLRNFRPEEPIRKRSGSKRQAPR